MIWLESALEMAGAGRRLSESGVALLELDIGQHEEHMALQDHGNRSTIL